MTGWWSPVLRSSGPRAGFAGLHAAHEGVTPAPVAGSVTSALLEPALEAHHGDLRDFARHDWPVRVLVPYGRTFFWVDEEGAKGFVPAMLEGLEQSLRGGAPELASLRVRFVPTPTDEMQEALAEGRGEIAAGAVVATPAWGRVADLSTPILVDFDLCVVAGPGSRAVERIEDLAGRTVVTVRGRAADDMVRALVPQFEARGLAPPRVEHADDRLSAEDLLDMVGTGGHEYTVLPRPLAHAWARTTPGLVVTPAVVATGNRAVYAVRKGMPTLHAALDAFLGRTHAPDRARALLAGCASLDAPSRESAQERPVLDTAATERLRALAPLFVEFGDANGIEPVQVAAQCFQESRFDPHARSSAGAMGLMQLMPATARQLGVRDPYDPRQSVEGGCKYMRWLAANFFGEPSLTPAEQHAFCLAAYNAGAGNVRAWRAAAREHGLDPNRWFGNVERIARARGVRETVTYVARITQFAVEFRARFGERLDAR